MFTKENYLINHLDDQSKKGLLSTIEWFLEMNRNTLDNNQFVNGLRLINNLNHKKDDYFNKSNNIALIMVRALLEARFWDIPAFLYLAPILKSFKKNTILL